MTKYRDYDAEMKLPDGKTCKDCVHYPRCSALGYARLLVSQCDFWPSRFKENPRNDFPTS